MEKEVLLIQAANYSIPPSQTHLRSLGGQGCFNEKLALQMEHHLPKDSDGSNRKINASPPPSSKSIFYLAFREHLLIFQQLTLVCLFYLNIWDEA